MTVTIIPSAAGAYSSEAMSETLLAEVPIAGADQALISESLSVEVPGLISTSERERPAPPAHHWSSWVPSSSWYCGNGTLGFGRP